MVELKCESYKINTTDIMTISSEDLVKSPAYNNFIYFDKKLEETDELTRILNSYNTNRSTNFIFQGFNFKERSEKIKQINNFETKKSFDRLTENDTTMTSQTFTESGKKELNKFIKPFYFVPCINCSNMIHIYDIGKYIVTSEFHSNICTTVKEEVLNNETSLNPINSINYKLEKLLEHLSNIQSTSSAAFNKDIKRDVHYYNSISKYIEEALNNKEISFCSLDSFKKIINNLNTFILKFNGILTTLIYIERTKFLVKRKKKIFKNEIKKKTFNDEDDRSNYYEYIIIKRSNKIAFLQSMKVEKLKEKKRLEVEKDFIKRKVNNLKSSINNTPERTRDLDIRNASTPEKHISYNAALSKQIINDITSDYDIKIKEDDLSEDYSITSTNSNLSGKAQKIKSFSTTNFNESTNEEYYNHTYRDFVRIYLKIKFDKLHKNQKGSTVDKNIIWKDILNKKIPQKQWINFILEELKKPCKLDSTNNSKLTKMPTIKEEFNIRDSL